MSIAKRVFRTLHLPYIHSYNTRFVIDGTNPRYDHTSSSFHDDIEQPSRTIIKYIIVFYIDNYDTWHSLRCRYIRKSLYNTCTTKYITLLITVNTFVFIRKKDLPCPPKMRALYYRSSLYTSFSVWFLYIGM